LSDVQVIKQQLETDGTLLLRFTNLQTEPVKSDVRESLVFVKSNHICGTGQVTQQETSYILFL